MNALTFSPNIADLTQDQDIQNKVLAINLSFLLFDKAAQLARNGISNVFSTQILTIAQEQNISIEAAFNMLMDELKQAGDAAGPRYTSSLAAYDQFLQEHEAELSQATQTIQRSQDAIKELNINIEKHAISLDKKTKALRESHFSESQIESILAMDPDDFDESFAKDEILQHRADIQASELLLAKLRQQAKDAQLKCLYQMKD